MQGSWIFPQALVQWKGQTESDATWEDVVAFRGTFPYFTLKDKGVAKTGAIDAEREVAAKEEKNTGNQGSGRKNRGVPGTKYGDFLLD